MGISRSLKGDKVIYVAREGRRVVARADNLHDLEALLDERVINLATGGQPPPAAKEGGLGDGESEGSGPKLRSRKSKEKSSEA